jgi:1-acyl-sn-glycerol-3-phosphate acyltransferase
MSEPESPQLRRERIAGVVTAAAVCLALPTVVLLVADSAPVGVSRVGPVLWFAGSAAVGFLVPLAFWAPNRALGFAPLAALGWLVSVLVSVTGGEQPGHWTGWAHGLPLGMIVGALVRGRRGPEPAEETTGLFFAVALGAVFAWAFTTRDRPFDWAGILIAAVAMFLVAWSWTRLFRPLFELCMEPVVWLMYHIRGRGPGLDAFPRTGPCIVLANHACWLDPLFLAKVIPRPITPMMTSRFYDLPVIRRLMVIFGVIRVPEKAIKKDAPEIQEAIAALDRGECLVVFPEGYLRRGETPALRRFGQGVWQVLRARPDTPVFACWIEGGWGSYTSFFNGKPTQNKRPDFRRPIAIGVSAGVTVSPEILAEQMQTRFHLMNLVAGARLHLGLPALPPFELPSKGEGVSPEAEDGGEVEPTAEAGA